MTVRELCQRMDSTELSEWAAYTRWFSPLSDPWRQTSRIMAAVVSPYCEKDNRPAPDHFVPIEEPPQHESQDLAAILELKKSFDLGS